MLFSIYKLQILQRQTSRTNRIHNLERILISFSSFKLFPVKGNNFLYVLHKAKMDNFQHLF